MSLINQRRCLVKFHIVLFLLLSTLIIHQSSSRVTTTRFLIETGRQLRAPRADNYDLDTPGTAVAQLQQRLEQYNNTLRSLFALCCSDTVCAPRFFISPDVAAVVVASVTQEIGQQQVVHDYQRFQLLLSKWMARDDGPFAQTAVTSALDVLQFSPESAVWWLRLMRTVQPCSENEIWLPEFNCVCPHDKTCHEIDAAEHSWELALFSPTVIMAMVVSVASVIWLFIEVRKLNDKNAKDLKMLSDACGTGKSIEKRDVATIQDSTVDTSNAITPHFGFDEGTINFPH